MPHVNIGSKQDLQGSILIIDDDLIRQRKLKQSIDNVGGIFTLSTKEVENYISLISNVIIIFGNYKTHFDSMVDRLSTNKNNKLILIKDKHQDNLTNKTNAIRCDMVASENAHVLLPHLVKRAQYLHQLEQDLARLQSYKRAQQALVSQSSVMLSLIKTIDSIADSSLNVLIYGESGTGKSVIARMLHDKSKRATMPYISVNCAAIPATLLHRELFGDQLITQHNEDERYSGGAVEAAAGGTLFLDDINAMPIQIQSHLVEFLHATHNEPMNKSLNIKLLCSSNSNLLSLVQQNQFNIDLYAALSELTLQVPPLRERTEDIWLLANQFLNQMKEQYNQVVCGFSSDAKSALVSYAWLGNIRELENKIKSAVILAEQPYISASALQLEKKQSQHAENQLNLRKIKQQAECRAIMQALTLVEGNMSKAANLLGISRPTLYTLVDKYALTR